MAFQHFGSYWDYATVHSRDYRLYRENLRSLLGDVNHINVSGGYRGCRLRSHLYPKASRIWRVVILQKVAVKWPIIMDRLIKSVIKLDGVNEETIYSSSWFAWIFTAFIAVMGLVDPISVLSMLVLKMMGPPIGSEKFPLSLMGILPAVAALLLWQNNMIRWLKAIERYRNHRVKKEIE